MQDETRNIKRLGFGASYIRDSTVYIMLSSPQACWHVLTYWGRVTHVCVSKLTIIGSDNGLSPDRRQAIIWTNAGILLIGPLGINFSEISIEILTFSFTKMRLKVSSAKRWPFCLGLNVLTSGTYKSVHDPWRALPEMENNVYQLNETETKQ